MSDIARTLGPPATFVPATLLVGSAVTSNTRASGSTTAIAAAAASHLNTGVLPTSGTGQIHRGPGRCRCTAHANGTSNQQVDAKTRQ